MSYIEIILLALALSIDAFVVSFSYGLSFTENRTKNSLQLAFFTGFFQGAMPAIGYFLAGFVRDFIEPYAGIIVFAIFMFLGLKFIKEAFDKNKEKPLCIGLMCLFLIGVATSIDAFSAGISLLLYGNRILKPVLLIAFITFTNSLFGFYLGGKLKSLPTRGIEIFAGLILIFLGVKALI